MANIRSLSIVVALAVTSVLFPLGNKATAAPQKAPSSDALFEVYSEFYLFQRCVESSLEMATRESYLTWLYQGINEEVKKRRKEDLSGTLEALSPPELENFSEKNYAFPKEIDVNSSREIYLALEKYQNDEFHHKYLQTRLIKDRLIKYASPAQRLRMFRADLESAMLEYRDGNYRDAIVRFDEVINAYGYSDIEDVVFYRAESYFAIRLYNRAKEDYLRVVNGNSDDYLLRKSIERVIAITGDQGDLTAAQEYWDQYSIKYGENRDEDYWSTLDFIARYQMAAGNWNEAIVLFDQVPPSADGFLKARLQAAQCAFQNLELEDAEKRISALMTGSVRGVPVPSGIKQKARFNLGLIDFLYGDYDLAFVNLSQIKLKGETHEMATIGSAWSLYKLGLYDKVIKVCEDFLKENEESQYQYEAISLIGYCRELLGNDSLAIVDYKRIMSAVDDRQEYSDINQERMTIVKAKDELNELEKGIFLQGQRDLFERYLELRKDIRLLDEKIRLAEAYKTSPFIKDLLVEQSLVYKTYTDHQELRKQIDDSGDYKLRDNYDEVVDQLLDLAEQIRSGIQYHLNKTTLIQREEKDHFDVVLSGSIEERITEEWKSIESAREVIRTTLENIDGDVSADLLMDLTALDSRLYNQQDKLLLFQRFIDQERPAELKSNLDRWSDFAYQRYTYKGLDFDRFYIDQERAQNLDNYIQRINRLINLRKKIEADTVELVADLVPDVSNAEPYYAPSVPLWNPEALWIVNVERVWQGEPPLEPESESEKSTISPEAPSAPESEIIEEESLESEGYEAEEVDDETTETPEELESELSEDSPDQPLETGEDEEGIEEAPDTGEDSEFDEFEEEMVQPEEDESDQSSEMKDDQTPNKDETPKDNPSSDIESPDADNPDTSVEEPSDPEAADE